MNNIKGDLKKFKEVKSEELLKIVLEKDELLQLKRESLMYLNEALETKTVVNSLKAVTGKRKNQSGKYQTLKRIGEGQFGCVYVCQDSNQKQFAVKKVKLPDETSFNNSIKEYQITQTLNHENVIKFYDFYLETGENEMTANIIMEYCPLRDLKLFILERNLSTKVLIDFALQIIKGIGYIHENNLIHRDLKPENILIAQKYDQFIIKIADFGLIKKDEQSKQSIAGTLKYMSPEMIKGDGKYTYSTDIFSFGAILYFILFKEEKYFYNEIFKEKFQKETQEKVESKSLPTDLLSVILESLSIKPETRPTAQDILSRIQKLIQE